MHRVYASIVSRQTSFTHCLRSTVNAGTMGNIFPTTASNGYIAPGHTETSTPNAVRWRPHHFDSRCEKLFCDGFCHENKKFYTGSSAHPNRTSEWVWSRGEVSTDSPRRRKRDVWQGDANDDGFLGNKRVRIAMYQHKHERCEEIDIAMEGTEWKRETKKSHQKDKLQDSAVGCNKQQVAGLRRSGEENETYVGRELVKSSAVQENVRRFGRLEKACRATLTKDGRGSNDAEEAFSKALEASQRESKGVRRRHGMVVVMEREDEEEDEEEADEKEEGDDKGATEKEVGHQENRSEEGRQTTMEEEGAEDGSGGDSDEERTEQHMQEKVGSDEGGLSDRHGEDEKGGGERKRNGEEEPKTGKIDQGKSDVGNDRGRGEEWSMWEGSKGEEGAETSLKREEEEENGGYEDEDLEDEIVEDEEEELKVNIEQEGRRLWNESQGKPAKSAERGWLSEAMEGEGNQFEQRRPDTQRPAPVSLSPS